jgi:hypothetical protein
VIKLGIKILSLLMIAIIGCTSIDSQRGSIYDSVNTFESKKPNFNGYNEKKTIEGRSKYANYKRILAQGKWCLFMTEYAYDHKVSDDKKTIIVYIWGTQLHMRNLKVALEHMVGNFRDNKIAPPYCPNIVLDFHSGIFKSDELTLDASKVKMFTDDEAEEYLKEHPDTEVIRGV